MKQAILVKVMPRRQEIDLIDGGLLPIESWGTHFSKIWIQIKWFPLTELRFSYRLKNLEHFVKALRAYYNCSKDILPHPNDK